MTKTRKTVRYMCAMLRAEMFKDIDFWLSHIVKGSPWVCMTDPDQRCQIVVLNTVVIIFKLQDLS